MYHIDTKIPNGHEIYQNYPFQRPRNCTKFVTIFGMKNIPSGNPVLFQVTKRKKSPWIFFFPAKRKDNFITLRRLRFPSGRPDKFVKKSPKM
jgi:hypothetical protein